MKATLEKVENVRDKLELWQSHLPAGDRFWYVITRNETHYWISVRNPSGVEINTVYRVEKAYP